MPLIDIMSELVSEEGLSSSSVADRTWLVDLINKAAKDLYEGVDLKMSYREQFFVFDKNTNLVTFPWRVRRVSAMRNVDQYVSLATVDMSARYRVYDWPMTLDYRHIGEKAIAQTWSDAAPITFVTETEAVADIELVITGRVQGSLRKTERLTLVAGSTSVTTEGIYEPGDIESLIKPQFSVEDVQVYADYGSANSTLIATIHNVANRTRYTVCQAFDIYYTESQDPLLECYYKHEFIPMVNDYDQFIAGDKFDHAIYWQARAKIVSKDEKRKTDAATYIGTAKTLAVNADNDYKQDDIQKMIASPNPLQEAMENRYRGYLVPRRTLQ